MEAKTRPGAAATMAALLLLPLLVSAEPRSSPTGRGIQEDLLDAQGLQSRGELQDGRVHVIVYLDQGSDIANIAADIEARLAARGIGWKFAHELPSAGAFAVQLPHVALWDVAASPGVRRLELDAVGTPLLTESLALTHVTTGVGAWSQGVTGSGRRIALIDGGFNFSMPELGACTLAMLEEGTCAKVLDAWSFTDGTHDVAGGDLEDHGTMVAVIAGGNSSRCVLFDCGKPQPTQGVARDARLLLYQCTCRSSEFAAAIERSLPHAPDAISISWKVSATEALMAAIKQAGLAGAVVVAAAGNSGAGHVAYPAFDPAVLGVGAVHDASGSVDTSCAAPTPMLENAVACFSGSGEGIFWDPVDGVERSFRKPDLVAPGTRILHALGDAVQQASGTSAAAPHAAGLVALLRQQHPTWNAAQVREKLVGSSVHLTWFDPAWSDDLRYGAGRVDARNAIDDVPATAAWNFEAAPFTPSHQASVSYACVDEAPTGSDGGSRVRILNEDGSGAAWTWAPAHGSAHHPWTLSPGDGRKTVTYTCRDPGGNDVAFQASVAVDTQAPLTALLQDPPPVASGWSAPAMVTAAGDDTHGLPVGDVSGVAATWARVDGGPFEAYEGPLAIAGHGPHLVEAYSVDTLGHVEAVKGLELLVDAVPPAITGSVPPPPPGGWYNTTPSVNLLATDAGSGVAAVSHRWNGGAWTLVPGAAASTSPPGSGAHLLEAVAIDGVGHLSAVLAIPLSVDLAPPTIHITRPKGGHLYVADQELGPSANLVVGPVTFESNAFDAVSGITRVRYSIDGQYIPGLVGGEATEPPYAWTWTLPPTNNLDDGWHVVVATAEDLAGNKASHGIAFRRWV